MPSKKEVPKLVSPSANLISTDPPSGTRDFFPEDMRLRTYLFTKWRESALRFGFVEYDAPVLEHELLGLRKAGEEITEQMYNFSDKEGSKVTLRPEITPQLVRMVLSRMRLNSSTSGKIQTSELLPLKWFSVPQCWRFETTQRGRKREHFQWNCDIIGVEGNTAELELFAVMVDFFKAVGLTAEDVGIRVNSRKILGASLKLAGVSDEDFAKVCVVVDKIDKIGSAEVLKQLIAGAGEGGLGLGLEIAQKVVKAVGSDFNLEENADLDGVEELHKFFELAKAYNIADWLVFDPSVVRGLSYYTGIVAECFDRKGQLRAVAGFGRYDRLFTTFGAPAPVAAVGFGMGDCVLVELLKERNLLPVLGNFVDVLVAAYPGSYAQALGVAAKLRSQAGVNVDMYLLEGKKIANVFKFADRVGARYMAFVAPGELEKNAVRIKDLRAGSEGKRIEKDVSLDQLAFFKDILNGE